MSKETLLEEDMLSPVLSLYPENEYKRREQFPFGRKRIDLVCVEMAKTRSVISIELKIKDWKKALWQASVNRQFSHRSYVAIWHVYAHRAQKETELFKKYSVGLIVVYPDRASVVFESQDCARRISRHEKCEWYMSLVNQETEDK